jgi:hypothetical protein
MQKPELRMATNLDGPRIAELHGPEYAWMDWSDIEPFWAVAELDERVIGCLQIHQGKPIGRLEMLAVDEELAPRQRALVVRNLIWLGILALRSGGSSAVSALIAFEDRAFKHQVKKHFGAEVTLSGNLLTVRT